MKRINRVMQTKCSVVWVPQWWLGMALIGVCWPLNWFLDGMRTAYLFFPLWLGFILAVDGIVMARSGSSLLVRARAKFGLLFLASSPVWWLFELINQRTGNWEYRGSNVFSPLEYYLLCTLSFSTVMPAVFEAAELLGSFRWVERFATGPRIPRTQKVNLGLFVCGLATMALTLAWPRLFYPFVWSCLVLILEPINYWLGRRHLLQEMQHGDWRRVVCLAAGAVLCGFFWEMWNYYSYPKWVYHTPGAQFLHIFEMPLLGYGGYIPFALELYSLYNFLWPGADVLRSRSFSCQPTEPG